MFFYLVIDTALPIIYLKHTESLVDLTTRKLILIQEQKLSKFEFIYMTVPVSCIHNDLSTL